MNGTVYVGEGAWGAPVRTLYTDYNATAAYNWTRNQASTDGFHLICITKEKIQIRTVNFDVVATVGQVAPGDPECTLPANLSIWTPSNGAVVEINNPSVEVKENIDSLKKIEVFPNPVNDFITISSKQNIIDARIEIYNGMGMLMKKVNATIAGNFKLSVEKFPEGAYFIFIKAKDLCESHKILVSH